MLDAIDAELRLHDRHMVAANGCGDEDTRQQSLDGARFLIERECDGIILCSTSLRDADFAQLRDDFPNLAIVNRDATASSIEPRPRSSPLLRDLTRRSSASRRRRTSRSP